MALHGAAANPIQLPSPDDHRLSLVPLLLLAPGDEICATGAVANLGVAPIEALTEWEIRYDPLLDAFPLPLLGPDLAYGRPSWTEIDGQLAESNSLTDGRAYTTREPSLRREGYRESRSNGESIGKWSPSSASNIWPATRTGSGAGTSKRPRTADNGQS